MSFDPKMRRSFTAVSEQLASRTVDTLQVHVAVQEIEASLLRIGSLPARENHNK